MFRVTPGTIQSCVSVLKDGHLLAIAPGKNLKEKQAAKYKTISLLPLLKMLTSIHYISCVIG